MAIAFVWQGHNRGMQESISEHTTHHSWKQMHKTTPVSLEQETEATLPKNSKTLENVAWSIELKLDVGWILVFDTVGCWKKPNVSHLRDALSR